MSEKTSVSYMMGGQVISSRYGGKKDVLSLFDSMAKEKGTNRSRLVTMFIEECVKANKILLPQFGYEWRDSKEQTQAPAIQSCRVKSNPNAMTFAPFDGTISAR